MDERAEYNFPHSIIFNKVEKKTEISIEDICEFVKKKYGCVLNFGHNKYFEIPYMDFIDHIWYSVVRGDCMIIGQEKGRTIETRQKHRFGMPNPEGYRKAQRMMRLAEKFNLPLISRAKRLRPQQESGLFRLSIAIDLSGSLPTFSPKR